MKRETKVSVIVPVFNMEKYLRQCVDSILTQGLTDFEVILVNDGSSDNSSKICEEYAEKDSRIKVIHKDNAGVSAARNDGITFATGKYVMFVDSDDMLLPNALEICVTNIENSNCAAVVGNYIYDYDGRLIERKGRIEAGEYTFLDLKDKIIDDGTLTGFLFGSVCLCIYDREVLLQNKIRFDETVKTNEDGLFNLKFIAKCKGIKVIDDYIYCYRQWKEQEKVNPVLARDTRFDACEVALSMFLQMEEMSFSEQMCRRKISVAFWNAIRVQNSRCNMKQAKMYLAEIFGCEELKDCYPFLDYSNMNIYKRVLCYLMRKEHLILFYLLVRYIVPIMKRYIKR